VRNTIRRLRFKTGTSFAIAALGCITFARLLSFEPLTFSTFMPFLVASIFAIAGAWRGFIYLHALRDMARS